MTNELFFMLSIAAGIVFPSSYVLYGILFKRGSDETLIWTVTMMAFFGSVSVLSLISTYHSEDFGLIMFSSVSLTLALVSGLTLFIKLIFTIASVISDAVGHFFGFRQRLPGPTWVWVLGLIIVSVLLYKSLAELKMYLMAREGIDIPYRR